MTVNRYVLKSTTNEEYYDGHNSWSPDIWEAKLYHVKPPTFGEGTIVVLVSVDIKEYPYEMATN